MWTLAIGKARTATNGTENSQPSRFSGESPLPKHGLCWSPRVEAPEVGVAAERFDRSLAPWKLLGTRKTNPKRAKNLRPAAGNKKGAQQEHGGYFARFDLVLCLAWIGYQIMLCRFVPFLPHVACVDTLRGVRYALRFTLHSKLRHERAGQALHG